MPRHSLLLLFFFSGICTYSQQLTLSNFNLYTTTEGLSHNHVTGLAQDSAGYIWISTLSGFNRFNGSSFVQFHSDNSNQSPASEVHSGIQHLNATQLGIFNSGLHIINTKNGKRGNLFIPYHDRQYQYKFNMVERAMGDKDGSTYVLTRSGFYHFDKENKLVSRFDYYSEADVPSAHFFFGRELLQLDNNRLLIVSVNGLYIYDKQVKKLKKIDPAESPLLAEFVDYTTSDYMFFQHKPGKLFVLKSSSDSIVYIDLAANKKQYSQTSFKPLKNEFGYRTRLFPVSDSLFYITGHNTGFYRMELMEGGKIKFHHEKFFGNYQCTALLPDSKRNLWVGTAKGLFHYNQNLSAIQTIAFPQAVENEFPNIVFSQVFVTDNKLYAGTYNFGNILTYRKNDLSFIASESFAAYRQRTGKSVNVYAMEQLSATSIMVGTNGPLKLLNTVTDKLQDIIPPLWNEKNDWAGELFKDSRGITWVSSANIYLYNKAINSFSVLPRHIAQQTQIRQPETICEDGEGNIWMAGHGISRYNTKLQRFDLHLDSFPFIKMPDRQVGLMVIDKKRSVIWFNSKDNGLIAYHINTGKFRHFTTADNLPANNMASLFIHEDRLWIGGYISLTCMDLSSNKIISFGKEDGFPDMPVVNGSKFFYDSSTKHFYLPFSKAIVRFDPDVLLQEKPPPTVFIESIKLNEQDPTYLPQQSITTSWKQTEIKITIGSINFSDAGTQRYAYRILKEDTTAWIETGTQPSFSISNLSPGNHTIQVKCYSATNRWPAPVREIKIIVTPPIWLREWFIGVMIALLLVAIYLLIGWRSSIARRKEMINTQIQKLKADDYKAQFELEQITNYFSSSLADKKTEEEVLWDVSKNLIGRMNYEDCMIYLWNKDKTKMIQKAGYGPKGKPEAITKHVFEVEPGQGVVGHVVDTKQAVLIHDTRKDKRYRVDDQFRLSELSVPIIHNDELLGVIDSEHPQLSYFNERDVKILTTIATLLGNKLKQIESEKFLEAKQIELAGINEQLAEARLSALQAQMNPHFVFNALNSIKRMILDADNEKASRYLSKFASMIRMTLEHSKEIFVTLDNNIEYLKAYLQMEQLRFDDSFTYSICVDENLDTTETVIPSMMIQPLVENAIWHGLMQATGDKKIEVSFCQCKNKVVCTVEDNGIGIHQAEELKKTQRPVHRSVGLENLRKRINIMNEKYDLGCSLIIKDLSENDKNCTGTRVSLRFNSISL